MTTVIPEVKDDEEFNPYDVKMCAQAGLKNEDDEVQKVSMEAQGGSSKRMRAAFLKSKIWPANTTIKIAFLKEPPANLKRTDVDIMEKTVDEEGNSLKVDPMQRLVADLPVKDAIIKTITERLQPIINVKLRFYDENNEFYNPNVADIRIDFNKYGGAWSLLGTECLTVKNKEESTMNFGWFDVPTTLHEFCHALGMIHEHQNPKGKIILWDKERVRTWAKDTQGWDEKTTNNNIIERYKLDEINGSTFDSKSIMLYFFPGNLVIDPETQKCCGTGTNQNLMFSPYDVLYLNYNYPLKKSSLTSEQFTVKYFNDVFNQQIDVEDLKKQLKSTMDDEEKSKNSSSSEGGPGSKAANALNTPSRAFSLQTPPSSEPSPTPVVPVVTPAPEVCKPGCVMLDDKLSFASILFSIIIILCILIGIALFRFKC